MVIFEKQLKQKKPTYQELKLLQNQLKQLQDIPIEKHIKKKKNPLIERLIGFPKFLSMLLGVPILICLLIPLSIILILVILFMWLKDLVVELIQLIKVRRPGL